MENQGIKWSDKKKNPPFSWFLAYIKISWESKKQRGDNRAGGWGGPWAAASGSALPSSPAVPSLGEVAPLHLQGRPRERSAPWCAPVNSGSGGVDACGASGQRDHRWHYLMPFERVLPTQRQMFSMCPIQNELKQSRAKAQRWTL